MPAQESNKTIYLEHPSGSKAEVALFGNLLQNMKPKRRVQTHIFFSLVAFRCHCYWLDC